MMVAVPRWSIRRMYVVLFLGSVTIYSVAALSTTKDQLVNGIMRRESGSEDNEGVDDGHEDLPKSAVLGAMSEGTETVKVATVKVAVNDSFPYSMSSDAFEFRIAPLRYGSCKHGTTVTLSSLDEDWKTCAARIQSRVGLLSCQRRRANMLWPRDKKYAPDGDVQWYPCQCCQADMFEEGGPIVKNSDTVWNLVWDHECTSTYTGETSCDPIKDKHPMGYALCEGGDCTKDDDRWTCCHTFAENCSSVQVNTNNAEQVLQGSWGQPYYPSLYKKPSNKVGAQDCGLKSKRPAMPKTLLAINRLTMIMKTWPSTVSFAWLGLFKNPVSKKWGWDDGTNITDEAFKHMPWAEGEPSDVTPQRGCIDRVTGKWYGCSWSVYLRIVCETWNHEGNGVKTWD